MGWDGTIAPQRTATRTGILRLRFAGQSGRHRNERGTLLANPNLPEDTELRLGLSSGALYPVPTEDVPALAARHGFHDLEIMLQTRGEYRPEFIALLAERCAEAGCRVRSLHLWHDVHLLLTPYARRTAEAIAMFDEAIAAAVTLEAPILVWHGADKRAVATEEGWRRFIAAVAERGAACHAAGRTLTIENVSWCAVASVREVAAFATALEEVDPERTIGFTFDPFQAVEAGANPFMLLAAMGERVANVHLSDRIQSVPNARHLPPGEGDLPWSALLRAIHAAYRGPMMLEGSVGADLGRLDRSRNRLNDLIAALQTEQDDPCAGSPPPGVMEGIYLFNNREFYACHEVIEHEWHAERRPIRRLYQGILQIGVGFHHALSGNHQGALLLLQDGIDKTSDFLPFCQGIETDLLVTQTRACLERLRELGPDRLNEFDAATIPRIMPFGAGSDDPGRAPLPEPIPISRYRRQ